MISISYAITVCSELEEIKNLISHLLKIKQPQDEIVVLYDLKNGSSKVLDYLLTQTDIKLHKYDFNNDFAEWKNRLMPLCSGDWIFNIDADEIPSEELMNILHTVLDDNDDVEVIWVPRKNIVEGITSEYIEQNNWNKDRQNRINWPDFQLRIYKNKPHLKWVGKVHETIVGFATYSEIPPDIEFLHLLHKKTLEKQIKQNEFYKTL